MQIIGSILMILFTYWLCKKDEWAANKRVSPPGYHTDWGKMSEDRILNGMSQQEIYQKQLRGGYDVKDTKYETWEEWKAKRPWGDWN